MVETKDLNEMALKLCEVSKKTLIFTKKSNYHPPFKTLLDFRESVFITESNQIFDKITENFDFFDCFILVSKQLNAFEQEFFNQLRIKNRKAIIELNIDRIK